MQHYYQDQDHRYDIYKAIEASVKDQLVHTLELSPHYNMSNVITERASCTVSYNYVNHTGVTISVVDSRNQRLHIKPTDLTGIKNVDVTAGINYYRAKRRFQIIEVRTYRNYEDVTTDLQYIIAKEKELGLSDVEEILKTKLASFLAGVEGHNRLNPHYFAPTDHCIVEMITNVSLQLIQETPYYVEACDVYLLRGETLPEFQHKDSITSLISKNFRDTWNLSQDFVLGEVIYIVDNDSNFSDRWTNRSGHVTKLAKVKDTSMIDGLYTAEIKGHNDLVFKHTPMEEVTDRMRVYNSREEALHEATGDKLADIRKLEADLESYKHKAEAEHRKSAYEEKTYDRKSNYEQDSYERKENVEKLKIVASVVTLAASMFAVYKSMQK